MTFPQTRHTLIQRLATDGAEGDWRQFLQDYWDAVRGFARRAGMLSEVDAEDIAALTFETILSSQLLTRWTQDKGAKLRTVLCAVVRNHLSNRHRLKHGRQLLAQKHADRLDDYTAAMGDVRVAAEDVDLFYHAWVMGLVRTAVEKLVGEYQANNRSDYFRVLHGRICEELSVPEIAEALEITPATVDNYYRHARKRLSEVFEQHVQIHVRRYCSDSEVSEEFQFEWQQLFDYLHEHGGLEASIQEVYSQQRTS